ncbi:MAG: class I SAM-dependent methyltransferase [Bacteroides fragilis]|nr:class I SAM-dependent methyltransferase [Bacteroides fragilis]
MDNRSFDSRRIAEGYRKRPWLHKQVIERIKKDCSIINSFKNGLDVGCGAGLSTKGLKLICEKVTGTDISSEMINICNHLYKDKTYHFYVAKAEETIIPVEKYDIVTAAGVISWVDREKFLNNASQVMKEQFVMSFTIEMEVRTMTDKEDKTVLGQGIKNLVNGGGYVV